MRPSTLRLAALLAAVFLLLAATPAAQSLWYVDHEAVSGNDDGTSWDDAFLSLHSAIALALPGDSVHVAGGVYTPGVSRTDSFFVASAVSVRGGYAGHGEPAPDARDFVLHETVLSGDLLGDDLPGFGNRGDNAYHVVTIPPGAVLPVVLDGLTVSGGQADGDYASGELFGGGVYAADAAMLTLLDCRLEECFAGAYGGGLCAFDSVVDMRRCEVVGNLMDHDIAPGTSVNAGGAGVYTESSQTTLFGCLFEDNHCVMGAQPDVGFGAAGAGLETAVAARVSHCRFIGNTSTALAYREGRGGGFGVLVLGSLGVVADCVFEGNVLDAPAGAIGDAGGAAWVNGHVRVVGCRFVGNAAPSSYGGGLAAVSQFIVSLITVENCEFSGNSAQSAAGLFVANAHPQAAFSIPVIGCTISGNHATGSTGGLMTFGAVNLENSIVWGNSDASGSGQTAQIDGLFGGGPSVRHCDVESWSSGGTGVISVDPLFVDPLGLDGLPGTLDDDLRLQPFSPCIDAGDDAALQADLADVDRDGDTVEPTPVELGGLLREADDPFTPDTGSGTAPLCDMGAYEFASSLPDERWATLGAALAGTHGPPQLVGRGTLCAFTQYELELTNALEFTSAALVLGVSPIFAAFKGGTMVPAPDIVIAGLPTGPLGELTLTLPWLDEEYPGVPIWWQVWIEDPGGPVGWSASNAVGCVTPTP